MSWRIEVDDGAVMRELRRLADGPDFDIFQEFSSTVHLQFIEARLDVHRITGSLYLSGKWDAKDNHEGKTFEGEVTFGGASPGGIHDPVDYAELEQSKDHIKGMPYGKPARTFDGSYSPNQGDHDFMRGLPALESGYSESILNFYRG